MNDPKSLGPIGPHGKVEQDGMITTFPPDGRVEVVTGRERIEKLERQVEALTRELAALVEQVHGHILSYHPL